MSLVPRGRRFSASILVRRGAIAGLVLHHLQALRLEDRVLDVLGEQARIVAAPGADHDAPALRTRRAGKRTPVRGHGASALQRLRGARIVLFVMFDSSSFVQIRCVCAKTMPASRCQPTSTSSPTAGAAASPRFGSCTTTRSAGDRRTCISSTAPRYETNSTPPAGVVHPARAAEMQPLRAQQPARPARPRRRGTCRCSPPAVSNSPGAVDAAVEERAAADEARDEAVGRALVEVALAADLADLALGHHHEAVRHGQRLLLVVRDHDGGEPELALQLADLDAHLLAQLGVEIGQRLVEQQHVGPDRERARERDALLLAAGQLARQPRRKAVEPHQPQRLARARLDLGLARACASPARTRRSRRPSCAGTARSSGTPCRCCAATAAAPSRRAPPMRTVPPLGSTKPGDHAQRRGLAAAGGPEQHEELAVRDVERHARDHGMIAVALGRAVD